MTPTRVGNTPDDGRHTSSLRRFFRVAFGITWGVGLLALVVVRQRPGAPATTSPLLFLAGWGPSIAGLACAARDGGRVGVGRLLACARPRRATLAWYPAVLVGYPLLALSCAWATGAHPPSIDRTHLPLLLATSLLADTGPLGEELGWRGFALPRLLARTGPWRAALLLGVAWTTWHLPTFFVAALPQSRLSIPLFTLSTVALSCAMTGLYRRSGGGLDLMILLHLVDNVCGTCLGFVAAATANVVLALGIAAAGWLGGGAERDSSDGC